MGGAFTSKSLSIFDLDRTLIRENSSARFCRYLVRAKVLPKASLHYSALYYLRHRFFGLSLSELHEKIFAKLLLGLPLKALEQHVDPFIKKELPQMLYMPAVNRLRWAQHVGHCTAILSSSPSFLVNAIAQFFDADERRGTEYAIDEEKKLSHIASIMEGELKAKWVFEMAKRLGVPEENIHTYSDSYLDLPFLLLAKTPVAVNPDQRLLKISQEKNWAIL